MVSTPMSGHISSPKLKGQTPWKVITSHGFSGLWACVCETAHAEANLCGRAIICAGGYDLTVRPAGIEEGGKACV